MYKVTEPEHSPDDLVLGTNYSYIIFKTPKVTSSEKHNLDSLSQKLTLPNPLFSTPYWKVAWLPYQTPNPGFLQASPRWWTLKDRAWIPLQGFTAGASEECSSAADMNASHPRYRMFTTVLPQTQPRSLVPGNSNPVYFISRICEFQTTGYNSTITF